MAEPRVILIVDDDHEVVGSLQSFLETKGYRVLTARDGQAGLELARRNRPDVVVVDMMMPKKSGFAVLGALKNRADEGPKVIMITANQGRQHRDYAEILGADDYLHKPFGLDRLLASVERLCPPNPESASN
jgi:DNA-binding response OmpR family regulator